MIDNKTIENGCSSNETKNSRYQIFNLLNFAARLV